MRLELQIPLPRSVQDDIGLAMAFTADRVEEFRAKHWHVYDNVRIELGKGGVVQLVATDERKSFDEPNYTVEQASKRKPVVLFEEVKPGPAVGMTARGHALAVWYDELDDAQRRAFDAGVLRVFWDDARANWTVENPTLRSAP